MSEDQLFWTYMPGETVVMKLEIIHKMQLEQVSAVFQHEDRAFQKIELLDDGDVTSEVLEDDPEAEIKSVWHLVGTVTLDHATGFYGLSIISLLTAAGRTINMRASDHLADRLPKDLRLKVIEEPTAEPHFGVVTLEPNA